METGTARESTMAYPNPTIKQCNIYIPNPHLAILLKAAITFGDWTLNFRTIKNKATAIKATLGNSIRRTTQVLVRYNWEWLSYFWTPRMWLNIQQQTWAKWGVMSFPISKPSPLWTGSAPTANTRWNLQNLTLNPLIPVFCQNYPKTTTSDSKIDS